MHAWGDDEVVDVARPVVARCAAKMAVLWCEWDVVRRWKEGERSGTGWRNGAAQRGRWVGLRLPTTDEVARRRSCAVSGILGGRSGSYGGWCSGAAVRLASTEVGGGGRLSGWHRAKAGDSVSIGTMRKWWRDAASRQRGGRVAMQGGTVDIPTGIRVCLVACLTYHIIQRHTLPRLR
jgi:hypothetical protein